MVEGLVPSEAELLAAVVGATANEGRAATVNDVRAFLRAQGVDAAPDATTVALQRLAHTGRLDRVDAAPGDDGLPVYGFRPATTGRTPAGVERRE